MLILLSNTCTREDRDRQYIEFLTASILKSITIPSDLLRGILGPTCLQIHIHLSPVPQGAEPALDKFHVC